MKVNFATGNRGKLKEMRPLFEDRDHSLEQVEVDVNELDALDVEDVARKKVIDSFKVAETDGMLIVEDTGFYVEGIGGFPGSEAAYFDKTAGADRLLDLLRDSDDHSAYFKTAIAVYVDGDIEVFTGKMRGRVSERKRGTSHEHLPYNSFFIPGHGEQSLAENPDLKDENFHRNIAVKKFLNWLDER